MYGKSPPRRLAPMGASEGPVAGAAEGRRKQANGSNGANRRGRSSHSALSCAVIP
jgi:hypothetical protein